MFLCNLNENGNTLRCSSDLGGLSSMLQLPRHFSLKRKRNFALFPSPNMPSLGKGRRGGRSERVKKKEKGRKKCEGPRQRDGVSGGRVAGLSEGEPRRPRGTARDAAIPRQHAPKLVLDFVVALGEQFPLSGEQRPRPRGQSVMQEA